MQERESDHPELRWAWLARAGRSAGGLWAMFLLCGWTSARISAAQGASGSGDAPIRVHGVVLNAVTQSPIPRVLVASADRHMALLTDDKGRFEFEVRTSAALAAATPAVPAETDGPAALPGWNAFLSVTKPGYRSGVPTPVPIDDASALRRELRLQMMPEATLAGNVRVAGGELPPGLSVRLLRRQVQDGRAAWMGSQDQRVDARGRYRFGGLAPGEYKIITEEWTDRVGPLVMTGEKPIKGYPAQAYPNGASPAAAGVIHLEGGRSVEADLDLRAAMYYPVEIPVVGNTAASFATAIAASDIGTMYSLSFEPRTHSVQGALPDGVYHLTLIVGNVRPQPGPTADLLSGTAELTVANRAVHAPAIAVLPGTNIPVSVREEYTGPDPNDQASATAPPERSVAISGRGIGLENLRVEEEARAPHPLEIFLSPEGLFAGGVENSILGAFSFPAKYSDDGSLAFEGVPPGRYRVTASARRGYAAVLTASGVNLLQQALVLDPGGAKPVLSAVLRDDFGTINATVSGAAEGKEAASSITSVWAFPLGDDGAAKAAGGPRQPDGSFLLSGVVPGRYLVLAGANQWLNLEFRNSDAMKPYESKGVIVEVAAGQKVSVSLKEAVTIVDWDAAALEAID